MKKVLIVDPNQVLTRLACDILSYEGYIAVPAFSATDAMKMFQSDDFDIVVTDLHAAEMTGLQLARALREGRPGVPVILMSHDALEGPPESEALTVCVSKQALFPALIESIRTCLMAGPA